MKHTVRLDMSAADAIRAIDAMPKERGSDFAAGRHAAASVNRTYTRVDGNQFQVSTTAGMGSPVVVSGKVTDDESGNAMLFLSTSFGNVPLGPSFIAGFVVLAIGLYFANAGEYYLAAALVIMSGYVFNWFARKLREARYLRSEISRYLGGVDWTSKT